MKHPFAGWLLALLQSDFALLALVALPAALPLLLNGGLPNTADGALHLFRTFELARAWADGVFYPRIAPDFAYGYGYPIFNYYAPLFYFVGQAFHVAGFNLEAAVKAAIILILYAYPLGMYLLVRDLLGAFSSGRFRREAALAAGAAYLYAPYRFYEAFIQGDYPQFLALALVPFCLWAATPAAPRRFRFFAFALAYGALVVAHNITALLATPLIGAYMLFVLARGSGASRPAAPDGRRREAGDQRESRTRYALTLAGAVTLAVGLTAFFWWPALGEQQFVRIDKLTHGFFDFRNYFLTPGELLAPNSPPDIAGVNPYIPFNLGPVALAFAVLGVLGALVRAIAARYGRRGTSDAPLAAFTFFGAAALVLAAMTLPVSTPLWASAPLLPLAEFPWRFVGLAAVPLAVLAGLAARELRAALADVSFRWAAMTTAVVVAALILDCFVYLFPRTPFIPYDEPSLSDLTRFELGTQALGTTSAGEYLPIWTAARMYDSPLTAQMLRDSGPDHLQREALPVTVRIDTLADNAVRSAYHIVSVGDLPVRVQRIFFPGWRATIDGRPVPLQLIAPNGVMQVTMPAGEHTVEFAFGDTPLRQAANMLALASLAIGVVIVVVRRRQRAPAPAHAAPIEPAPLAYRQPLVVAALLLAGLWFVAPGLGYVRYSKLPDVAGMQHARGDAFGEEMRLLGYDLSAPSVTAGDALALTFYWQPLRVIEQDYAVFAHLDNPLTLETVAQTWNERPGNISTLELPLSLYVRDPHVMNVPADLAPGVYLLRVGMLNPRTGQALTVAGADGVRRTRLPLQPVRVRAAAPPDLSGVTRTDARFGEIELLGYTLDQSGALTLYWRAAQTPGADATVFVHLFDADGKPAATFDGPPAGGLLPSSAWEPGEIAVDRRAVKPGAGGPYRIAIGLYDPQSNRRYAAQAADGTPLADDQLILDRTVTASP